MSAVTNLRIIDLEHSGWSSRPRNAGVQSARGEYVLFMDHDDSLYPDALRRAYDYAVATGADLLSPKESKTNDVWWGSWDLPARNIPNALADGGILRLLPMVPHKLYWREFLLQHEIRFPEGRRMLWEDIDFNVKAYRQANAVAVLADTPFYLWHAGGNTSSTYGPGDSEYWDRLDELFAFFAETLAGPDFEEARIALILRQFEVRVLRRFSAMLPNASTASIEAALARAQHLQNEHVPEEMEARLGKVARARAILLRQGRPDLLRALYELDRRAALSARATAVQWRGGRLRLRLRTEWAHRDGLPLLQRSDGRTVRLLPNYLLHALPQAVTDVTDDLDATRLLVGLRSPDTNVTWTLEPEARFDYELTDDGAHLVAHAEVLIDPDAAAVGGPIESGRWKLHAAVRWLDVARAAPVTSPAPPRPGLRHRRLVFTHSDDAGQLVIDLAPTITDLTRGARRLLARR